LKALVDRVGRHVHIAISNCPYVQPPIADAKNSGNYILIQTVPMQNMRHVTRHRTKRWLCRESWCAVLPVQFPSRAPFNVWHISGDR